jgi:hypothetical protein
MWSKPRLKVLLGIACALCLGLATSGAARQMASKAAKSEKSSKTVYVCACMGTKSCPCMSMAKKEGKCACGEHSPDMKEVSANSDWAKTNRKALE